MKKYKVCGLGNALVDVLVRVPEDQFLQYGLERGTMRLVAHAEQEGLLSQLRGLPEELVSGGSVANSVIAVQQLGGAAAMLVALGQDRFGEHYGGECRQLGVHLPAKPLSGKPTGTCLVLITPCGERTMRTCLAASADLSVRELDEETIRLSEWLFIEGYLFANGDATRAAIRQAITIAKRHGTKVALTVSEAWIISGFAEHFYPVLKDVDLLFAKESEAKAFKNDPTPESALKTLLNQVPSAVITCGPQGAHFSFAGQRGHVPAFACAPVDLTGAGDMFAGAFLYGITEGLPPDQAARSGCYLAMKVITQVGARLRSGVKEGWKQGLKSE